MTGLTADCAQAIAASTLAHLDREFPNKLDHLMAGADDVRSPRALHPIFFGSFDWHSCVHGWWQVMRIARLFPDLPVAAAARDRACAMLTPQNVAGERAYLDRVGAAGFERPYGWGWLLALHRELGRHAGEPWANLLEPLARAFAARFAGYLPRLGWPVRAGAHGNSAFALILAHDWATAHDPALATLIADRASAWFGDDRDARPWEPGGEDFLSPTLVEAVLMARVLPAGDFAPWFATFLPTPPPVLLTPVAVSDRSDGKIAHLDGLNLSRAWCWRALAPAMADPADAETARAAAEAHLAASLPHLADDYMGEHWLGSFALLALGGL